MTLSFIDFNSMSPEEKVGHTLTLTTFWKPPAFFGMALGHIFRARQVGKDYTQVWCRLEVDEECVPFIQTELPNMSEEGCLPHTSRMPFESMGEFEQAGWEVVQEPMMPSTPWELLGEFVVQAQTWHRTFRVFDGQRLHTVPITGLRRELDLLPPDNRSEDSAKLQGFRAYLKAAYLKGFNHGE